MMKGLTMPAREPGPGERATRTRTRTIWGIFGTMAAGGLVLGAAISFMEARAADGGMGTLPPLFAIVGVGVFVLLGGLGSLYYFRTIDEVEKRNNFVAATWGLNALFAAYPAWFMLWKGGLAIEPMHEALFIGTLVVTVIAYGWLKIRT